MQTNRRFFLRNGALALAGTTTIPSFLIRSVLAETAPAPGQRLVVIFQRGAADGLNIVVPYREQNFYSMRPGIAIPQNKVLDLDGSFGLHPSLASFKPLFNQGHLAIVHAAGSPDLSRSHFDAQDFMESGTPGVKSTERRLAQSRFAVRRPAPSSGAHSVSRACTRRAGSAHTRWKIPAIALSSVNNFAVVGRGPAPSPAANAFQAMYGDSGHLIYFTRWARNLSKP